jgi:hypothetical protein
MLAGMDDPAPESPPIEQAAPAEQPGTTEQPPPLIHWSEIEVKVRPRIRDSDFPVAARSLEGGPWRCVVRITVDPAGVPVKAEPRDCPDVFVAAAHDIAMRYRYYPLKPPETAAFDLAVNFQPADGSASDDWLAARYAVSVGTAPVSSASGAWAASSTEVLGEVGMAGDSGTLAFRAGARGRAVLLGLGMDFRTLTPVAPFAGGSLAIVTNSPELGFYFAPAIDVGVDVRPKGRFGFSVGARPELDLSIREGFAWRLGVYASVNLCNPAHPAWKASSSDGA